MKEEFERKYIEIEKKNWWFVSRRRLIRDLLNNYLQKNSSIIDIGCGPGENLNFFNNYKVLGLDNSDLFIKYARENNLNIIKSEFPNTPFSDNFFDGALCLDVLEHIEDDFSGLKELRRITRLGGITIISVPAHKFLWSFHDELNLHKRRYNKDFLSNLIKKAGFKILKISYWNMFLFAPVSIFKFINRFLNNQRVHELAYGDNIVNSFLTYVLLLENLMINKGVNLPIGISLVYVLRKSE